ncbi:hypothetical protein B296_00046446 [Ensete ventricosum]|uniref:Uncharacterized protein n=1 Tax=Ensete ventricosum TaxID=4639 RepID=A0A426YCK6_ENSVE|nr:hypothetical protein B296_00046446 [Ensete ventricosum]
MGYERFTHRQPLAATRNLWYERFTRYLQSLPTDTYWLSPEFCGTSVPVALTDSLPVDTCWSSPEFYGNLATSPLVFFLAISLRVSRELFDSFGESPSELSVRTHHIVRTWPDA